MTRGRWWVAGLCFVGFMGLSCTLGSPGSAEGQMPRGGPEWTGTGEAGSAASAGVSALGANPALLGLRGGPASSVTVGASGGVGLEPLGLGDLARHQDTPLSSDTREAWLTEVGRAGSVRGHLGAHGGPLGYQRGPVALQISTTVTGRTVLDEDAAELLLFGNAGRHGEARDLEPEKGVMEGAVYTGFSAGGGWAVSPAGPGRLSDGSLSVGAALHLTMAHRFIQGRDRGSVTAGDPTRIDMRFGIVDRTPEARGPVGWGAGLDLGAAWEGERSRWSLVLRNALNTFQWRANRLRIRPGEAHFGDGRGTSDFEPRPLDEAPEELRRAVEATGFGRSMALATSWELLRNTRLLAEARHGQRGGLEPEPASALSAGLEHRPWSSVPVRAGLGWIRDGYQGGLGAGWERGPATLDVGLRVRSHDGVRQPGGTAALTVHLP